MLLGAVSGLISRCVGVQRLLVCAASSGWGLAPCSLADLGGARGWVSSEGGVWCWCGRMVSVREPGLASGCLAGGLEHCCRPVRCLLRGWAWFWRIRAAVGCGASWLAVQTAPGAGLCGVILFVACSRGLWVPRAAPLGWVCWFHCCAWRRGRSLRLSAASCAG